MQARTSSPPPLKRSRRATSPTRLEDSNGHASSSAQPLQPLSLSILGVEPLDEFIKEIADFVHHMIKTRPDHPNGKVEVEAKIGVLRDRNTAQRLALPVLVETSTCHFSWNLHPLLTANPVTLLSTHYEHDGVRQYLPRTVQSRDLSPICPSYVQFFRHRLRFYLTRDGAVSNNISTTINSSTASKRRHHNRHMSAAWWTTAIFT